MTQHLRITAVTAVRLAAGLALTCGLTTAGAAEANLWPAKVSQLDENGHVTSWQAIGPFAYEKPAADGGTVSGVRPFYAKWETAAGALREVNVLYPIFTYRADEYYYRWSVLQLINRSADRSQLDIAGTRRPPLVTHATFDVWPFWFSRDTGSPESSYRGLLPVHGTIKNRFGYDQLNWTLFPLYARAAKNEAVTYATPWPLIKTTRGSEQGFAFWPLFGWRIKPGAFERRFYLWPLGWNNTIQPAAEAGPGTPPRREVGFLPFYTREIGPGLVNENYLWPFFGYTRRTEPVLYHENRYFWPFLVQGHGDERTVSRYGPFYTRSVNKGIGKTWILWPVFREKRFADAGIAHRQRQVLYFLYWSLEQRSTTNPAAAPAEKSHLWPLYSKWDNGAGRKQLQFPSPLELFFPDNDRVRQSWSPLFSLYRYDQREPGRERHEALWGLVSWDRAPNRSEFHFGPLVSVNQQPDEKRVALGNGLVGLRRTAGKGWRVFWFDFPAKANKVRDSSSR
jgi:hypothetical protein